jgi:hypothetical protein
MPNISRIELNYIKHFFDGIDFEVSRLFAESDAPEESLTSILGMLLDSKSFHNKLLSYKISDLNQDLKWHKNGINIEFQTYEHKKHFEGNVSKADLGIILEIVNNSGESIRKGILIQCKKLKTDDESYNLNSKYNGLAQQSKNEFGEYEDQLDLIIKKEKRDKFQYCYLFYNPSLKAFESEKNLIIRYEGGYNFIGCNFHIRPGIKVTDTNFIVKTIKNTKHKKFSLKEAYESRQCSEKEGISFINFSSFMTKMLKCEIGTLESKNPRIIDICNGKDEKYAVKRTIHITMNHNINYGQNPND